MKNKDLVREFFESYVWRFQTLTTTVNIQEIQGSNLILGQHNNRPCVLSYGYYPICIKLDNDFLIRVNKYSKTTATHINLCVGQLEDRGYIKIKQVQFVKDTSTKSYADYFLYSKDSDRCKTCKNKLKCVVGECIPFTKCEVLI